jgi:hypothetical protein
MLRSLASAARNDPGGLPGVTLMHGRALIVDAGVATVGAGPVLTAVVAGSGSTFTVRNSAFTSPIWLLDMWRQSAHKGEAQITSPKLVPVSNGIRIQTPTGLADFLLPGPPFQGLTPQDLLTVNDNGTAADVDLIAIQSYYQDLPGVSMTLKSPGDIVGVTDYVFGWPVAVTSSGTAGNQNSTVVTTTVDSSTANIWYAMLGYIVDGAIGCVGLSGVDTSATFIGGPGDIDARFTRTYFADLSERTGLPCIPLWNAANKGNTNIVVADHGASTSVNVTMILAQLNANYQP